MKVVVALAAMGVGFDKELKPGAKTHDIHLEGREVEWEIPEGVISKQVYFDVDNLHKIFYDAEDIDMLPGIRRILAKIRV